MSSSHLTVHSKSSKAMASILEQIDEGQIRALLLRVLAWRVGDLDDLPAKLAESYSISASQSLELLEGLCQPLDIAVSTKSESAAEILKAFKWNLSEATKEKIAKTTFELREKCVTFLLEHSPSLSRVLYHDWKIETQIATESLGRIARPVASITLRIQPAAKGSELLPPLESVSMELAKDMVDALSSGFDRLQIQLSKIVQ